MKNKHFYNLHMSDKKIFSDNTNQQNTINENVSYDLIVSRNILIIGEIDLKSSEDIIKKLLILDNQNNKPITLYINSPSGDFDYSFAIYDTIKYIQSEVFIIGIGILSSASILIMLATPLNYRFTFPHTSYCISFPQKKIDGKATQIEVYAKQIEIVKKMYLDLFYLETNELNASLLGNFEYDIWWNADDAVKYSIVSRILNNSSEIKSDICKIEKLENTSRNDQLQTISCISEYQLKDIEIQNYTNHNIISKNNIFLKVYSDKFESPLKGIKIPLRGEMINALNLFWSKKTSHIIELDLIEPISSRINIVEKLILFQFKIEVSSVDFELDSKFKRSRVVIQYIVKNSALFKEYVDSQFLIENKIVNKKYLKKLQKLSLNIFNLGQLELRNKGIFLQSSIYTFGIKNKKIKLITNFHNFHTSKMFNIINTNDYSHEVETVLLGNKVIEKYMNKISLLDEVPFYSVPDEIRLDIMREQAEVLNRIIGRNYKFAKKSPSEIIEEIYKVLK